jgi:parallel beta-helix repeat protein
MIQFHIIFLILLFIYLPSLSVENKQEDFNLVHPKIHPKRITVGGPQADLPAFTSQAIQIAVDALTVHGGGTIKLMPGIFEINAPVKLSSNTSLVGSGPETILHKVDGVKTNFVVDADYGELKVAVADPKGFEVGMGVQVYDQERRKECWNVTTAEITAIEGNVLYIDNYLVIDYHIEDVGIVSNACPVVAAISVENVSVTNLAVDGNKESNDFINGCVGGGIYLHKVKNALVENCLVKNWNGDGISWQITENVTVRNNEISDCTNIGMHPGTGSPGSIIEGNNSHHNGTDGLFVCWRVQYGTVKDNQFHHNKRYGICTGHKDSDMLYIQNHIYDNDKAGVNLREEKKGNAPHRSIFRENIIENNGDYGFLIESPASDVLIENNTVRDSGKGKQKVGVFVTKDGYSPKLKDNKMNGHKDGDVVDNSKK